MANGEEVALEAAKRINQQLKRIDDLQERVSELEKYNIDLSYKLRYMEGVTAVLLLAGMLQLVI